MVEMTGSKGLLTVVEMVEMMVAEMAVMLVERRVV
jgi:hypothetical protein